MLKQLKNTVVNVKTEEDLDVSELFEKKGKTSRGKVFYFKCRLTTPAERRAMGELIIIFLEDGYKIWKKDGLLFYEKGN